MLEILQFYVSGFWAWAGITMGAILIFHPAMHAVVDLIKWFAAGFSCAHSDKAP